MRRLVLESLPSLSPFSIEILLSSTWGEIRDASPQVVPFLKQAVSRQWPQISPSIPGLALLRLAEFDPSAALDLARDALFPATFRLTMRSCWRFRFPPLRNSIKLCSRNTGKGSWWMRELRASPVPTSKTSFGALTTNDSKREEGRNARRRFWLISFAWIRRRPPAASQRAERPKRTLARRCSSMDWNVR